MDMNLNDAENGKHTGMILINLQKIFKNFIRQSKVQDKIIKLFLSYLTSRVFFVSLKNVTAKKINVFIKYFFRKCDQIQSFLHI